MVSITSHSPGETYEFGRAFAASLRRGDVLALCGDLGAGKTHFVKGLAAGLGAPGGITSPTFTLIHEHNGGSLPLYHVDFYRLEEPGDALKIGIDEYLNGDGVTAVEWADKFAELIPEGARWIRFVVLENDTRRIEQLLI
jgi:tRNA threonylcarbamoyladenosine biosynthesis protein TsaE